jgi:hypothetical protein
MALIDLKSNLKKSNVYKDTPGGGNSGLPYIKQGLPEDSPAGEYLAGVARSSLDVDIRGGAYSTIASTEDTVRISRFLNDFSRGTVFTSKQIGLQKSNPLIETEQRGSTINTRVYSNSNLLAQVANQGTGVHVPRAGFNTNDLLQDKNKYEKIVIQNNNAGQNRLVTLYNSKINTDSNSSNITLDLDKLGISSDENTLFDYIGGPGSSYGDGNTFIGRAINTNSALSTPDAGTIDYLNSLGLTDYIKVNQIGGLVGGLYKSKENQFSKNNNVNFGSITTPSFNPSLNPPPSTPLYKLNIPSTSTTNFQKLIITKENIDFEESQFLKTQQPKSRYQQSSPDFIRPEKVPEGVSPVNQFGNTMGYSALLNSKAGELQDFRSSSINPNPLAEDYNANKINIATRVGIGNPGARTDRSSFYKEFKEGQDRINMSPIFKRDDTSAVEQDYENTPGEVRDLIKFCIEAIDNGYPDQTNRMHFRAFLTNFSDNISADWNGQKYMGRGENFYTYQGFGREVGFTFKVAAQAVEEMEKLYQKLNYLASTLHPDYSGQGFMRGTIHKLTIGEYFYRMPGIIKSMNITIEDNYPWEIKMKQPEQRDAAGNNIPPDRDQLQMELPQILNVQMSFAPIYDKLPQRGLKQPIILSDKIANNYLSRPNFKFSEK